MKIKELQKTVNISWSPAQHYPILLATGTAAQQIDTSSNINSELEIYSTNLDDQSYDLQLRGNQQSQYRFHKLIWSPFGSNKGHSDGLIVGGCESGHLQIFSATKLMAGEDALIAQQDKHTGPIRGLDFNPFQNNLLASAASESELFIWDLNNTSTPMPPGTKSQPLEDIQNVAWNKQVQHIVSAVFSSKCVIWDLRKNEQIIKLSDTQSRVRWRATQWHPNIATQLWLASEDDQAPLIELWDLRYATAPTKTCQIHQRGVLGITWCPKDPDLMVSCGKDNKIFCWNPNSDLPNGEILSELATTSQWCSDVQWCPRDPALIASSSLDGNVLIYSLFGGRHHQIRTSNKIADSFPGIDQLAQTPIIQQVSTSISHDPSKPPKWLLKPAGATFGFGGRLYNFINNDGKRFVNVIQVITEPELIKRSTEFEKIIQEGNIIEYCREKADEMTDQHGRYIWYFIKANFELDPKAEMLNLLGYNREDINKKFEKYLKIAYDREEIDENNISNSSSSSSTDKKEGFLHNDIQKRTDKRYLKINTTDGNDEGLICQAILSGNIEAAVEMCLQCNLPAEAIIIAATGGSELLARTQYNYLKKQESILANIISSLVVKDWMGVVTQCSIDSWREILAGILTHSGIQSSILCEKLGERLLNESLDDINLSKNAILCYICAGNIEKLIDAWNFLYFKDEQNKKNTIELQNLIEIVILIKKFMEVQGQNVIQTEKMKNIILKYADILCSQGALNIAYSYIDNINDQGLIEIQNRLHYALGYDMHKQKEVFPIEQKPDLGRNRFSMGNISAVSTTVINNNIPPPSMGSTNQSHAQQNWNNFSQFNQHNKNYELQQMPFNNTQPQISEPLQPSTPFPGTDNLLPPPLRPGSVGQQGQGLIRAKYLIDPSVSSGPMNNLNYNLSSSQQNFNQGIQTINPIPSTPYPVSGSNEIYNQNYISTFPSNAGTVPNQYQLCEEMNTKNQMNINQMIPPSNTFQNNFTQNNPDTMQNYSVNSSLNSFPHQGNDSIEGDLNNRPPPTQVYPQKISTSPSGWNDPPMIQNRHQSKQSAASFAPIMQPLVGMEKKSINAQQPQIDPNFSQEPGPQKLYQAPHPPSQFQHSSYSVNSMKQDYSNVSQSKDVNPVEINQKIKAKPPVQQEKSLPEEYIHMKTVLEELKNCCFQAAKDARYKKKCNDLGRRLETLYDALRENKLSQNTVSSLNDIVQYIQNGDYQNAMLTYTAIVSGCDFSQTASFMPGIKVLLQSATELKVYLR